MGLSGGVVFYFFFVLVGWIVFFLFSLAAVLKVFICRYDFYFVFLSIRWLPF